MLALALAEGKTAAPPADAAQWAHRATWDDVARVYPAKARRHGVEGMALVACRVTTDGALADCKVDRETPARAGFGEAALKLMPRFRMRLHTKEGASVEGGIIKIPIEFRLPGKAPRDRSL
jgi:TonB family protein